MERNIKLSVSSQTLLNEIINLKHLTEIVYSEIRTLYSPEDSVSDGIGDDILTASHNLQEIIEGYVERGIRDSLSFLNMADIETTDSVVL